jgi:hypothetical protein
MKHNAFHWPDRTIGKKESRVIRDEHNALFNDYHRLVTAARSLMNLATAQLDTSATKDGLTNAEAIAAIRQLLPPE